MSLPKPLPFQEEGIRFLLRTQRALLADEMGCLDGDTIVKIARGRFGTATRHYKLSDAFKRFNTTWDKTCPAYIRAFDGKQLKLHRIKKILFKGSQDVYEIKTKRGYKIRATLDHEFLTSLDNSYTELRKLRVGSTVYVNGVEVIECKECGAQRTFSSPSLRLKSANPDLCAVCSIRKGNQDKKTRSKHLPPGVSLDKSGYVMVKQHSHPFCDQHGLVRQHVLVMEKHLGRYLRFPKDVVHHKNGNRGDNRLCNLELHTRSSHAKHHAKEATRHLTRDKYGNKIFWVPEADKIISKKLIGRRDVYDVVMYEPHRNFVANGFIVHNCGKSPQAIFAAESLEGEKKNILVICPASLILMWEEAIRKFLGGSPQIIQLREMKDPVIFDGTLRFVIVSYNYLWNERVKNEDGSVIYTQKKLERLKKVKWSAVILDEAHNIKNWKSVTCRAIAHLMSKSTARLWMLTGTPATNDARDYYPYLNLCMPGKWGTLGPFSEVFCNVEVDAWSGGKRFSGVREDKRKILRAAFKKFMLRRLKRDVQKQLPPVIVQAIKIPVDAALVAECLELESSVVEACIESGKAINAHVMKVDRSIGLAKVSAAVEYILGCSDPIVIFAHHVDVIAEIGYQLEKLDKTFTTITGANDAEEKHAAKEAFQNGEVDIILLNIKAGGTGITLTRSSHMLVVEPPWSYAILDQAHARIDRIGQVGISVNITHLVAKGTLDEKKMAALKYKSKFMKEVMGDDLYG